MELVPGSDPVSLQPRPAFLPHLGRRATCHDAAEHAGLERGFLDNIQGGDRQSLVLGHDLPQLARLEPAHAADSLQEVVHRDLAAPVVDADQHDLVAGALQKDRVAVVLVIRQVETGHELGEAHVDGRALCVGPVFDNRQLRARDALEVRLKRLSPLPGRDVVLAREAELIHGHLSLLDHLLHHNHRLGPPVLHKVEQPGRLFGQCAVKPGEGQHQGHCRTDCTRRGGALPRNQVPE